MRRPADWFAGQWLLRWIVAYGGGVAAVYIAAVHIVPMLLAPDFPELPLFAAAFAALWIVSYVVKPKRH